MAVITLHTVKPVSDVAGLHCPASRYKPGASPLVSSGPKLVSSSPQHLGPAYFLVWMVDLGIKSFSIKIQR